MTRSSYLALPISVTLFASAAGAQGSTSPADEKILAPFDIVSTQVQS